MATITSTQSGNWSATGTWVGGVVPGAGDLAIIASPHTVVVDVNTTIGDKAAATGIGVTINATNASTFGTLQVAAGVTFTMRGFNLTTAVMMKVNQFATFAPQAGSTIVLDPSSDGSTILDNRGIISAVGTANSRIVFTTPAAALTWTNAGTQTKTTQVRSVYDKTIATLYCDSITHAWISNSGGTALGSSADSSAIFSAVSPAGILASEVASVDLVNGVGKYWIDYNTGVVVWWQTSGTYSYTINYKYLTTAGACIRTVQNTVNNEGVFDYCDFNYLGSLVNADDYTLHFQNRQSAAVGTSRRARVTNCIFRYCKRDIGIKTCTGTQGDPILIQNNQFLYSTGDIYGYNIMFYRASNSWVTLDSNIAYNAGGNFIQDNVFGAVITQTGFVCTNNIFRGAIFCSLSPHGDLYPGAVFQKNYVWGYGGAFDSRGIAGVGGTNASHATVQYNVVNRIHRGFNYTSYEDILDNYLAELDHHGINAFASEDDAQAIDVQILRNVLNSAGGGPGAGIETGYNHRTFSDNLLAQHNTIHNVSSMGGISFGDQNDNVGPSINAKVDIVDNLLTSNNVGIRKLVDTSADRARLNFKRIDYNNLSSNTADFANYNKQGTFIRNGVTYNTDGTRGCLGVSIHNPSYASTFASKALVLTYTSATNITLTWDGGVAVQLVLDSGTATAGANVSTLGVSGLRNGTLTDTGKTWTTSQSVATSPLGNFVMITGGTGAGQARAITNNTATVLTVAPAWTTPPDATSTYAIIKTEVQLFDSGAVDYVYGGIDARDLPTTTQTDSGISLAFNSLALAPSYVDTTRTVATWDTSLGGTGTELGAWNRLVADPTLLYSSLYPYLMNGFKIQTVALSTAASDGTQVGAMALSSGNGSLYRMLMGLG